jgi:hypothetical protein
MLKMPESNRFVVKQKGIGWDLGRTFSFCELGACYKDGFNEDQVQTSAMGG